MEGVCICRSKHGASHLKISTTGASHAGPISHRVETASLNDGANRIWNEIYKHITLITYNSVIPT